MRRYPIALAPIGDDPRDAHDYQGTFRVGYNVRENALYLALTVRDESIVTGPVSGWDSVDGCMVFLDARHQPAAEAVGLYHLQGTQEGKWWGPGDVALEQMRVAARRSPSFHYYEWRLGIGRKTQGQVRLRPGVFVGLEPGLWDRDADGFFTHAFWGVLGSPPGGIRSIRLGEVVLVDTGEALGILKVRLRGEGGEGVGRVLVEIHSLASEGWWVRAWSDGSGIVAQEVPAGRYRVAPRLRGASPVEVEVRAGEVATMADLAVPPPRGQTVQAGTGRANRPLVTTVAAGPGYRQGSWRVLGVADGLSDPIVTAICKDRDGSLWFGTSGGGVVRYDGEEMTRYETPSHGGLDRVLAVLQDPAGSVWFGTAEAGLTRFDGHAFVTYTTADGLPADRVEALAVDRQGELWLGTSGGLCHLHGRALVTYTAEDGLRGALPRSGPRQRPVDRHGLWPGSVRGRPVHRPICG